MVEFVNEVEDRGYDVYGLTGRGASQEQATLDNLTKVGYDEFTRDNFFTKCDPAEARPPDCHTSVTRTTTGQVHDGRVQGRHPQHIEYDRQDIVLNIGDQWSDLQGGHADTASSCRTRRTTCRAPTLQGAPAGDADLVLPTEFTWRPTARAG